VSRPRRVSPVSGHRRGRGATAVSQHRRGRGDMDLDGPWPSNVSPGARAANRCAWARAPLDVRYHDLEWGVPLTNDRRLFELLILEGAQAGLSWSTILRKRPAYRRAFDRFDPRKVAAYGPEQIRRLLANPGLVRNRAKMRAAVDNARAFLAIQREHGSFRAFVWGFVNGRPRANAWRTGRQIPAEDPTSRALSDALRARGFRFVGPTICYAFMQAAGLVNDHTTDCFRWKEVRRLGAVTSGRLDTLGRRKGHD
jgi:DNA-3-methyladenine glycosylase I